MIDVKKLKGDQLVYVASPLLIEERKDSTTFAHLVLPVKASKWYASANAPTFYGVTASGKETGPWQAEDGYLTKAEALVAGMKLAARAIEAISRDADIRIKAITRLMENEAPTVYDIVKEAR